MYIYFNPETNEYPRFMGDIQLIDPEWNVDKPLPEPWVLVKDVDAPEYNYETETIEDVEPKLQEDGSYIRQIIVRNLTQEELNWRKLIKVREKVARGQKLTKEEAALLTQ